MTTAQDFSAPENWTHDRPVARYGPCPWEATLIKQSSWLRTEIMQLVGVTLVKSVCGNLPSGSFQGLQVLFTLSSSHSWSRCEVFASFHKGGGDKVSAEDVIHLQFFFLLSQTYVTSTQVNHENESQALHL